MQNFKFDVDRVTEQLNRILQMELAGVVYYTHYSFMIYGHARIPITQWLRENATESLAHAQEAGQMIMRLHKRPDLGIAKHYTRATHGSALRKDPFDPRVAPRCG